MSDLGELIAKHQYSAKFLRCTCGYEPWWPDTYDAHVEKVLTAHLASVG